MAAQETYNDKVVRQFAIMTVVWGIVGMLVGVVIAAQMAWPALNFDIPWLTFSRLRPFAHQCRGVRLRRQRAVRDLLLRRAAHLPCAAVLRRACGLHLLGLAGGDRRGGHHAAARDHHHQGVRRARMADRHFDYRGVGRLRDRVLRHARQAPREPHLRRQLVLRRVHPDHRPAARGQQRRAPGFVWTSRTRSMPACRTPWCSGGTVTTPWAFS